ncbi:Cadherin-23 [Halocaridina rubra]|uniref:Cadherin-23 n=1 Tax=Halocaridina rubra TaxID=373956 RepID=A0AAN8ZPG9_HALRR
MPEPVSFFDSRDDTLLKVHVFVNDINDNAPKFTREVFTGGITTESDFGLEVMKITAVDPDIGENGRLRYYMDGRVQETLSENLDNIRRSPFLVDPVSGIVKLNFDPQKGMKGYFDFKVYVNDTSGRSDRARVFIYLLREDQRVRFILRQSPDEVREQVEYFRDYLGNVTGAIVNVDDFRVHENHDGTVDKTKTDLYLHLVNRDDNSVLEVKEVLAIIDKNVEYLDHLFKELNVLDTQRAELVTAGVKEDNLLFLWLVGVIVFLTLLLVLTVALCLSQRARYSRQLKAATATAFGECSHDNGLNRSSTVPNTNIHSVEGSNPIWMSGFDNDWYKDEDSLRYQQFLHQSEGNDSLDDNAVDTSLSPRVDRDMPYITSGNVPNPLSR